MGIRLTKNWTLKSDSENIRRQLAYVFLFYYFNNKEQEFQLKERISLKNCQNNDKMDKSATKKHSNDY